MTSDPEAHAESAPTAPAKGSRSRWWHLAITFIGGALVGVLITGLLISTTPDFGSAGETPEGANTAAPTAASDTATVPVVAEARVNAACLRVINEAQDVYRIISGVGQAVDNVDLAALDDMVRRLQPIEPRLARDLQACQVDTQVTQGSSREPGSPVPTLPQPTSSPT